MLIIPSLSMRYDMIFVIILQYTIIRIDDRASLYIQQYKSACHSPSPQYE